MNLFVNVERTVLHAAYGTHQNVYVMLARGKEVRGHDAILRRLDYGEKKFFLKKKTVGY